MAVYSTPSTQQLADFSGREVDALTSFAPTALGQAALLFSIVTGIDEEPDDARQSTMILNAILDMALHLYDNQPYTEVRSRPYSSETMMSYSYTVGSVPARALDGSRTGLVWWDLAISRLGIDPASVRVSSASIMVFENLWDADAGPYRDSSGNVRFAGPADLRQSTFFPDDTTVVVHDPS